MSVIPLLVSVAIIISAFFPSEQKYLAQFYGRELKISGILADDAEIKDSKIRLRVGSLRINDSINALNCQVYIMLADDGRNYERSDSVEFTGVLAEGFGNYAGFMYLPTIVAHNKPDPPDLALQIRNNFMAHVRELFDAPEAGLALGYLIGDKTGMSDSLTQTLRVVGLSHVVVTSGFHLSVILNLVKRLFGKISRSAIIFAATALTLCFVAITGLSASMARAGLMSLITLYAWYFGRKIHPGRLLLYVAAITLWMTPSNLFNLGWQLSFASFAGIIFLAPLIAKYLYGDCEPNFVASSLITSVAAQICCLPLSVYNFGMFSVIGIVVGLIITPTISIVMLLVFFAGTFCPSAAILASAFLKFHLGLIDIAAKQPWSALEVSPENPAIFLLYLPIVAVFIYLKLKTKHDFRPRYALDKSPEYGKIYPC